MIEHERSYILSPGLCKKYFDFEDPNQQFISDYYLDRDLRVRCMVIPGEMGSKKICRITEKKGNKADGFREEKEFDIPESVFDIMKSRAILVVHKTRKHILIPKQFASAYEATLDIIDSPMNLAVLEVEAKDESAMPVPENITEKLFACKLRSCPLSAVEMFKRKIGICGGPSAGKSETAKLLSHTLNTVYNANSFHVAEYATTFIQKYRRNPDFYDQPFIWLGQRERERDAEKANIVISDCPTFLSYIYMLRLNPFPLSSETSLHLSKIYKRILFDLQGYTDIIFLELQKYNENGVRYHDEASAKEISNRIKTFLNDHRVKYRVCTYNDLDVILQDLFYMNNQ